MSQTLIFQKVNICEEEPVDLMVNGKRIVTFMCTLKNLRELAVGHLYSRGMIKDLKEIYSLSILEDMGKIYGITTNTMDFENFELSTILSSNCGCGGDKFSDKLLKMPKIKSKFKISMERVKELTVEMFSKAEMYKHIGGMHCAAISDGKDILALNEDVGRHNAADKTIGEALLSGVDFSQVMIMTTGRISSDMIIKAANVSCPLIVSRSIPTTLALELANKLGITLIGRAVSSKPIIYIYKERIAG